MGERNGPRDAEVVVVGEAPGAGDPGADRWQGGNWTGMAYTSGHSGRRIRSLLADVGYPDAYYTNAVKCFPPGEPASEWPDGERGDGVGNREPTAEERANCRPYLRQELETVAPRVVVPTGKHATQSVLALVGDSIESFLNHVLEPLEPAGLEPLVVPVLRSSYQDVWRERLGHTPATYRAALADLLADDAVA